LATARRLPAVIGVMALLGCALQLASLHARSRSTPSFSEQHYLSPSVGLLASSAVISGFMLAFYFWSRRSPVAAVLSTFAVYASLVFTHVTSGRLGLFGGLGLVVQVLVLAALLRGLRGGLEVLAEDEAETRALCPSCGERSRAAIHCGICGAPLQEAGVDRGSTVPHLRTLLLVFVGCLALSLFDSFLDWGVVSDEHVEATSAVVCASVVCVLAWRARRELRSLFRLGQLRPSHALYIAFVLVLYLPGIAYFDLLEYFGIQVESMSYLYSETGEVDVFMVVFVCVVIPLIEEAAFRGHAQQQLGRVFTPGSALVVQAVLFAAVHLRVLSLPSHVALGLAFGWLRQRTGSIYPSVVAHGAWNAVIITRDVYGWWLL
jgi:membrane protease YdiL (CAAX protease family)